MNREEINKLLLEAGDLMEGEEDEGFIGAYFCRPDGEVKMSVVEGGTVPSLTFLIARVMLCIAATHEVKPRDMMKHVRAAYNLMLKYHKGGVPIGEIEKRDLGTD